MTNQDGYRFTVEVYTQALVFSGSFNLPIYRRVSDALNSRLQRFITLSDATVAPLWKPQQAQRVPRILVDWGDALLVATIEEPPPPPGFQTATPPRDARPMMFFTPVFALRAEFYQRTDKDLAAMISEMTDDFVALTNASIFPLQGGSTMSRSFVCLSLRHLQALYGVGASVGPEALPAAPAPPFVAPPPPVDPMENDELFEPPAAPTEDLQT
jgi:hypothetical protein